MRKILKKLDLRETLTEDEYTRLLEYSEQLCRETPESYELFYQDYAAILAEEYFTYLPRFRYGIDDLVDFLTRHPVTIASRQGDLPLQMFPEELHPYLRYLFTDHLNYGALQPILQFLNTSSETTASLPEPRTGPVVCKFEEANPYKETGLKAHFDRLSRYQFITRLQTYRYLRRNKASHDKIEVLAGDRLGGIFTNKEKSIYYHLLLSENDIQKAANACRLLNLTLYGRDNT